MNHFEEARALLIDDLRKYLIGPVEGDEEIIPERAYDRYHIGILAPSGAVISQEEIGDLDDSEDVGGASAQKGDGVLALANAAQQSAIGFTFQVPVDIQVKIDVTWADYVASVRVEPEKKSGKKSIAESASDDGQNEMLPDSTEESKKNTAKKLVYEWKRLPKELINIELPATDTTGLLAKNDGIHIEIHERRVGKIRIITVSVVNRRVIPERGRKTDPVISPVDRNAYQVTLAVRAADDSSPFISRPSSEHVADPEFLVHELLYRNVRQFAVGHGCSVDWNMPSNDSAHATTIHAEWLPVTEVFKASSDVAALAGCQALDVDFLASAPRTGIIESLRALPRAYDLWISHLDASVEKVISECSPGLASRIRQCAAQNLDKCRTISIRITEGIDLLADKNHPHVFRSFVLANDAMSRSMKISRKGRKPEWRPFQLAFLLLAIPSTAYGDNPARNVLDLIWFPTGGGKTEAYLALIAFTLFHRRLSALTPEVGGGTAVITRYTLRLLTMQQFERAARTIMACEVIRRDHSADFGNEPFSIGLFVGNSFTPGTLDDATKVLRGTHEDKSLATLPVTQCPWCGNKLKASVNQKIENGRLVTRCTNASCDFKGGIPITCVDEEMYAFPPSMIIGTVDKFAMMAWEPLIGNLFGLDRGVKPPELIIQDELHLIGDALGSMTALYETAIDILCTHQGIPPKIVGSTATIRRAEQQIRAVFMREVAQFPPSGLDHDDSFFYRENRNVPGRKYVGVHAQGRSPKFTLVRLMGVLGQGAVSIENNDARDHYWTITTYFNSLRELGGAWVLGLDDVPKYIRAMPAKRTPDRKLGGPTELTSHVPSTEIPRVLENIAASINVPDENREPVDMLLCTNMISVGVDIDRLGMMIVHGQPKTTAEYIQASSRVGRPEGAAGLVVTQYNWTRPRDRSHYERFRSYHESFYRHVEATSVTPFSMRARGRALHGVFVALLRLLIRPLADSPAMIENSIVSNQVDDIIEKIVARVCQINGCDTGEDVRADLEIIRNDICAVADNNGTWKKHGTDSNPRYLRRPNEIAGIQGGIETPQSMRDVDPPCAIVIEKRIKQERV
jgi:hypothetical protein